MEHIYKKISLDIHDDIASSLTISVKQGDTARGIQVNLTDHGKVYTIPDGCTATFSAKKDNGKFITDSCTIENNTIIYDLNEDVVSVGARLDCEITVYSDAGVCITSPSFTIFVYKKIQDEYADDVIESDSFKVLDNLISEATSVIAETENATKRLDEAVGEAETAVNNAVSSANEAVENANSAISEANEAIGIAKEASDELMAFLSDLDEESLNKMLDEVLSSGYTVNVSWWENISYNYNGYIKPDNGEEVTFNPDTSPYTFNNVHSLTFGGAACLYVRNADTGEMLYEKCTYESFTLPITSNMNLEFAVEA